MESFQIAHKWRNNRILITFFFQHKRNNVAIPLVHFRHSASSYMPPTLSSNSTKRRICLLYKRTKKFHRKINVSIFAIYSNPNKFWQIISIQLSFIWEIIILYSFLICEIILQCYLHIAKHLNKGISSYLSIMAFLSYSLSQVAHMSLYYL